DADHLGPTLLVVAQALPGRPRPGLGLDMLDVDQICRKHHASSVTPCLQKGGASLLSPGESIPDRSQVGGARRGRGPLTGAAWRRCRLRGPRSLAALN